ncbi:MAG: hypothetical protein LAO21_00785 [Acidobacteriia bacterium]|nr:hypothetical protein [Terriglobia bacterium]
MLCLLSLLLASPLQMNAAGPNPTSLSASPNSITMPGSVRFCAGGGANMTVDLKYYWDGVLYETDYGVTFGSDGCVDNWYDSDSFAGNYTFRWIRNSLNGPSGAWANVSTPLTLYPQPSPPTISYFYADQSTINIHQCTIVRWSSENATSVDLSGEDVPLEYSTQECPLSTAQYVLTAHNESGQTARAFYTIHVNTQVNDAVYVDQTSLPAMEVGRTYSVYVTMRNTGTTTWTEGQLFRLGSRNPSNNTTWGLSRVSLAPGESVPPGATKTFAFNVVAPANPNTYYFQWQMTRDGVGWSGAQSPSTPASAVLPPTSMNFSPTQGNAGNDMYTLTVGGGANISIGFKYEWSGNIGNVVTVDPWEHALDGSGQARNIKVNHNDAPGTYWYRAIKIAGAPDWVNFSSPYPSFTILPPKPFTNSLSITPGSIKPPASYTMTARNTGGAKVDTRFMLNNGGPLYDTGFPTFNPALNNPPGEPAQVTVNAATCTTSGDYLFTGLRNTLLPTSDWSDQPQNNIRRIFVSCPDAPALDQNSPVVPSTVAAGASNAITINGTSLCGPVTITSDNPGITFSNPTSAGDYSGGFVTASMQVAAAVAPGPYLFTVRTPCDQVSGTISVAPPSLPIIAIADTQGSPTDLTVQYGSITVTQESPHNPQSYDVTLKNVGAQPLAISSIGLQHHVEQGWSDGAGVYSMLNLPALPVTLAYGQTLTFSVQFDPSFDLLLSAHVNSLLYFSEIVVQSNDPNTSTKKVGLFATATANGIGDAPNGLVLRADGADLRGIYDLNTGPDSTTYELVLLGLPVGDGIKIPFAGSQNFNADNVVVTASGEGQMSLRNFVMAHGGSILGVSNTGGDTTIQFKMAVPKLPLNTSQGSISFSFQTFLPATLTVYDYTAMCDANILDLFNKLQVCVVQQSGGLSGFDLSNLIINGKFNPTVLNDLQQKSASITNCLVANLPPLHAILDLSRRLGNLSPGQIPEILTDAGELIQFLPVPASVKKAITIAAQVAPLIETLLSHVSKADKIIALAKIGGIINHRLAPTEPVVIPVIFLYPCIVYSVDSFSMVNYEDWFLPGDPRVRIDGIEVESNCAFVGTATIRIHSLLIDIVGMVADQLTRVVRDIPAAVAPGGAGLDCDPVTFQCRGQEFLEVTNSLKALQISPTTLSFTAPYGGRSGASSFDVTNTALLCPRPSPDSLTYQIPVGNACGIPFFPLQQMTHHQCDGSGDETLTCPSLGLSSVATNGLAAGDSLNFSHVFDLTDMTLLGGRPIQTINEKVVFPGFGCVNLVGNVQTPQISQDKALWYFGRGNQPPLGFTLGATSATLTANGVNTGTFVWTIINGTDKLTLENNSTTITKTNANTLGISSTSFSTKANDVTVQLNYTPPGATQPITFSWSLSIDSPYKLVPNLLPGTPYPEDLGISGSCGEGAPTGTDGFQTIIRYQIRSFFNSLITVAQVNESFSDFKDIYIGNNWGIPPQTQFTTTDGTVGDYICIGSPGFTPTPLPPQSPLSDVQIDQWTQAWFVGSLAESGGVLVQTNTLVRYQDHARHTNIKSPVR